MKNPTGTLLLSVLALGSLVVTAVLAMNLILGGEVNDDREADLDPRAESIARQSERPTDADEQPALRGGVIRQPGQPDPPVLVAIDPFTLTDRHGEPFGLDDLRGKVWLANFIFTRCPGPCPAMTSRFAELHIERSREGWDDLMLVTVSVDPAHDTPEVLAEYARLALGHPDSEGFEDRWRFLTGEREHVWRVVREGFKLPVGEADDPKEPIFHSQKVALVDRQGRIRGYFDALDNEAILRLRHNLALVEAEPPMTSGG